MCLASLATTLAKDGMLAQPKAYSNIVETDKVVTTEIKPEIISDSPSVRYDTSSYSVASTYH